MAQGSGSGNIRIECFQTAALFGRPSRDPRESVGDAGVLFVGSQHSIPSQLALFPNVSAWMGHTAFRGNLYPKSWSFPCAWKKRPDAPTVPKKNTHVPVLAVASEPATVDTSYMLKWPFP